MRNRFRVTPAGRAVAQRAAASGLLAMCIALGACAQTAPANVATAAPTTNADAAAAPEPANATAIADVAREPAPAADSPRPPTAPAMHTDHDTAPAPAVTQVAARKDATQAKVDASLPRMQVHKSPTCGCCSLWVDHMREAGFAVEVHDTHDLAAVKSRLGVPLDAQSCHTAEVGGLVVEGHVPAPDIKRALAQGGTRALVLPGMPINSPGMEMPGVDAPPYTVERITADGTREPFATHGDTARDR